MPVPATSAVASDILRELAAIVDQPYQAMQRFKSSTGKRAIACAPMHFPEEIIHAAGMLPVVLQESNEPVTFGHSLIHPFFCGFVRSNIDLSLKGSLGFLDFILVTDTCLQMRAFANLLRKSQPRTRVELIQFPPILTKTSTLAETVEKMQQCRRFLEELGGHEVSDAALRESIALFNRQRGLLRRVYAARRANPAALKATDVMAIVQSAMVMPREEHVGRLEQLVPEIESLPAASGKPVRIFVSGHLCQAPRPDTFAFIESFGGVVAGDDLYAGARYIGADVSSEADPITGLARKYVEMAIPCPTKSCLADWGDYLVEAVRGSKSEGVVIMMVKFCEPHYLYYPDLKARLEKERLPHLMIETEHEVLSMEGVRTRIQAFVESISSRQN